MDLDNNAYSKLILVGVKSVNFVVYRRILYALSLLRDIYNHETPEMWCSRICDPFRKILEENPRIFSKKGYISMCGKLYESGKESHPNRIETNYIYCSVCDSLVFVPQRFLEFSYNQDSHLKRCITGDTIANEHAKRKEILQSIDDREFIIWQYKQYILREEREFIIWHYKRIILQEENNLKRLQLELSFQSIPHSEKDKLALVSYDNHTNGYGTYVQTKLTIAKDTTPSTSNFELFRVLPARQEMVSLTSDQSPASKGNTGEIFISSRYAKQNNLLPSINYLNQPKGAMLRLRNGVEITIID